MLVQRALDCKRHVAVYQCKQGVIHANTDVVAGVELGTTLAHDDGASADQLTAEPADSLHHLVAPPDRLGSAVMAQLAAPSAPVLR